MKKDQAVPKTIWGTTVQYRKQGEQRLREKHFEGDAQQAAHAFVEDHVAGLTEEEYKKLPKKEQRDYEPRRMTAKAGDDKSLTLFLRKVPLWVKCWTI